MTLAYGFENTLLCNKSYILGCAVPEPLIKKIRFSACDLDYTTIVTLELSTFRGRRVELLIRIYVDKLKQGFIHYVVLDTLGNKLAKGYVWIDNYKGITGLSGLHKYEKLKLKIYAIKYDHRTCRTDVELLFDITNLRVFITMLPSGYVITKFAFCPTEPMDIYFFLITCPYFLLSPLIGRRGLGARRTMYVINVVLFAKLQLAAAIAFVSAFDYGILHVYQLIMYIVLWICYLMGFKVWLGDRYTTFKVTKVKINGEEVTNLNAIIILPALSGPAIILSEIFILGP